MKQQHIIIFFISCFLGLSTSVWAQKNETTETKVKKADSTKTSKYGIRLGTDVIKLTRSFIDDKYSGFEILGDYRLTKRWFVAASLGNEERDFENNNLNVTTKGNYIKAGVDYNMHDNLFPLDNMIYSGFRVGYSNFSQTINQSTIYDVNQYWQPTVVNNTVREFKSLNAIWVELLMGIKAEVLNNLYVGINVQLKYTASNDTPDNFANLYIPGVNKVFEGSKISTGINYNISYRIPIFKK